MNRDELKRGDEYCLEVVGLNGVVLVKKSKRLANTDFEETRRDFTFDYVFNLDSTQEQIFQSMALPVLENVLNGYNGTIIAYGQTGSGKTFTMQGPSFEYNNEARGVIPRIAEHAFKTLNKTDKPFEVKFSMIEMYNEELRDLLSPGEKKKLELRLKEDKVQKEKKPSLKRRSIGMWKEKKKTHYYVENMKEVIVNDQEELIEWFAKGTAQRVVNNTKMNENSSRSHMICMITIQSKSEEGIPLTGTLYLVDLAGSEKLSDTELSTQAKSETININKSLFNLRTVIKELITPNRTFISYNSSKLTTLLKDSFGGNSKTSLIVTCSPSQSNDDETLSTLNYGSMARGIKNKPEVNAYDKLSKKEIWDLYEAAKKEREEFEKKYYDLEKALDQMGMDCSVGISMIKRKKTETKKDFEMKGTDLTNSISPFGKIELTSIKATTSTDINYPMTDSIELPPKLESKASSAEKDTMMSSKIRKIELFTSIKETSSDPITSPGINYPMTDSIEEPPKLESKASSVEKDNMMNSKMMASKAKNSAIMHTLKSKINSLEEKNKDLEKQLEAIKAEKDNMNSSQIFSGKTLELKTELLEAHKKIDDLTTENENLKIQLEESLKINHSITQLKTTEAPQGNEASEERFNQEINKLKTQIEQQKSEKQKMSKELFNMTAKINDLEAYKESSVPRLGDLEKRVKEFYEKICEKEKKIEELTIEVNQFRINQVMVEAVVGKPKTLIIHLILKDMDI